MVALGLLMTGSRAAAEDIAQETFSRALTAKIRETSGSVHGYLGTIAYRLALKEIDRASRHVSEPNSELVAPQAGPLEEILVNERDRAVTRAIRALPANHRDVLILRFYAGRTYEEIAAQLDVPLGTVKSRIFYAVKACRNSLHESGVL